MPNSDEVNVDLTNYRDKMGQRVAPGRYLVLVEDAELDKSNAGNQMINLWLRCLGGEFDGSVIVDRLTLTEKALFRVVGFMQALGIPTPRKRIKINLGQFRGRTLEVDVEDGEPYNGRVKSEVRGYFKTAKSQQGGTDGKQVADLDDLENLENLTGLDEFRQPEQNGGSVSSLGQSPPVEMTKAAEEADPAEVDLDKLDLG